MSYRKSSPYPTQHHGRRITPELLVCHTTEGGTKKWLDRAFSGTDSGYHFSVHWCIYQDGEIVEYAPWKPGEAVACWHAGRSEWNGRESCNYWSIGFEIQHMAGQTYPQAQIDSILDLLAMVKAEYPGIELVTHKQIAMPRGRKSDPTYPWDTEVWPQVWALWNGEDMAREDVERLIESAQAQSYRGSITNALLAKDYVAVERLNKAFYVRFPDGETGLPEDWESPKA